MCVRVCLLSCVIEVVCSLDVVNGLITTHAGVVSYGGTFYFILVDIYKCQCNIYLFTEIEMRCISLKYLMLPNNIFLG